MNNKLFFLILSLAMIAFTIISICTAPIVNKNSCNLGTSNCKILKDIYDANKDGYDDNKKKGRN